MYLLPIASPDLPALCPGHDRDGDAYYMGQERLTVGALLVHRSSSG